MNRRSSDSIAHNRLLQEMHDQAGDDVRVRVQCKYNGSWGEYDGIISYQPTGYKANYKVEFDGEDGAYIKCPLVSGLEGRKIQGIIEIKPDQEEEEEEEPDAMDQEGEEEEAMDQVDQEEEEEEEEKVPMQPLFGEFNTESSSVPDQGDEIGEFWSKINYKVGRYTVRVVGQKNNGVYWVRQWQPKKLEFKGKQWERKANQIKEKK